MQFKLNGMLHLFLVNMIATWKRNDFINLFYLHNYVVGVLLYVK